MPGVSSTERRPIPRPVWYLGWTSFLTDAATEIVYPLLPVYLSRVLAARAMNGRAALEMT